MEEFASTSFAPMPGTSETGEMSDWDKFIGAVEKIAGAVTGKVQDAGGYGGGDKNYLATAAPSDGGGIILILGGILLLVLLTSEG